MNGPKLRLSQNVRKEAVMGERGSKIPVRALGVAPWNLEGVRIFSIAHNHRRVKGDQP